MFAAIIRYSVSDVIMGLSEAGDAIYGEIRDKVRASRYGCC